MRRYPHFRTPQWTCFVLSVCFGITINLPSTVHAQTVTQAWVARYNGPGNGADEAQKVITDSSGNVYVTGHSYNGSNYDFATLKYDTNGNQLWIARYDGGQDDEFPSIGMDASGNVYVTGWSHNGSNWDVATVKYDSNGNQRWVARYDSGSQDYVSALAVDAAGNVYVTGSNDAPSAQSDYITVKYDTTGQQLWVTRYDNGYVDISYAISVDTSGNAYVTGQSCSGIDCSLTGSYATVKYSPAGNQLWVARYGRGVGRALSVDTAGNVYVTGDSDSNYGTLKYDIGGNLLWAAQYDNGSNDVAYAIGVDASGNVYVTGDSCTTACSNTDYATVKYDPNGNPLWVARYDGGHNDFAAALALDHSGNVYVTGDSYRNLVCDEGGCDYLSDYVTVKYDANGNQLWLAGYDRGGYDFARSVAVDTVGNVYVTGGSYDSLSSYDYATVKYIQTSAIGTPTTLTLTPAADTNTVGTDHTVTATVKDAFQQPTAGITVRFSVEGSITASGAAATDINGRASFTYSGPLLPGADLIHAYADTNNNGIQDAGEPFGNATKAWILPTTTPGQVTGGGQAPNAAATGEIAFGFNAKSDDLVKGNCNVVDPAISLHIKCASITTLVITGTHASLFGTAIANGAETPFGIDVDDLAEPGKGADTFRIILGTGYAAGGVLTRGNIQIHQ